MHDQGTFASFCLGLQKYIYFVCMVKDIIPSSCKQEQPQINSKKSKYHFKKKEKLSNIFKSDIKLKGHEFC